MHHDNGTLLAKLGELLLRLVLENDHFDFRICVD